MKTVILADRLGADLADLTSRSCVALLPVGGKSVLEHTLDSLVGLGLSEAVIVAPGEQVSVFERLAGGSLVGTTVECVPALRGESPDAAVAQLYPSLGEPLLIVRGDVLRSACVADFLARSTAFPGVLSLAATIGGRPAGLRLVRPGSTLPLALPRDPAREWREGPPRVELRGASLSLLESAAAYYRTQIQVSSGCFAGLKLRGHTEAVARIPSVGESARWAPAAYV